MGIESIRFFQFRNVVDQTISLRSADGVPAREIFLTGENGQGKTNFLEGLYLLAYGSSFRTKVDRKLCHHGDQEFSVSAEGTVAQRRVTLQVKLQDGKKHILVDGRPLADRKELVRNVPCIAFTHEDYQFVSGGPEYQRLFFDQTLSLFDVLYIDTLRQYRKLLKSRNALLGTSSDPRVLDVYESQLMLSGRDLMAARRSALDALNPLFSELFSDITGLDGSCTVRYQPSWKHDEPAAIEALLRERRESDRRLGFTSAGPHRDRFIFAHAGRNFADHASTGQVRLMSLLLRIVQARLALEKTGRPPLLLLDDVLLELDPLRRQRILNLLPAYDQAFFTFLPDEKLEPQAKENPLYLRVEAGQYAPYGGPHG